MPHHRSRVQTLLAKRPVLAYGHRMTDQPPQTRGSLLLISGSRSFVRAPWAAQDRVRAIIHAQLCLFGADDCLMTGNADGPDKWAITQAASADASGLWWVTYLPNGERFSNREPLHSNWAPEGLSLSGPDAPLVRDKWMAMALDKARNMKKRPFHAWAIGFVDPDSPTKGTDYTLAQCKSYKIPYARFVREGSEVRLDKSSSSRLEQCYLAD